MVLPTAQLGTRRSALALPLTAVLCALGCSAGAANDADDPQAVPQCIDGELVWSFGGGWTDTSMYRLRPCARFEHERYDWADPRAPVFECSHDIAPGDVALDEIDAALREPAVKAALSESARFGVSPPDAPVFKLETNAGELWIGFEGCRGASKCLAPPAKVTALRASLNALQAEQMATDDCIE